MGPAFPSEDAARAWVWDRLLAEKAARFQFPPHGRIPNFAGTARAATRLMDLPDLHRAKRIKVNPDAPQRFVRQLALERGIAVFMPTPRLRGGFILLEPAEIPTDSYAEAARLGAAMRWGKKIGLRELPQLEAIVVPADPHDLPVSVIVTPEEVTVVENPPASPDGIAWELLGPQALKEMPLLAELRRPTQPRHGE